MHFYSVPLSYLNFLPVSRGWLGGGGVRGAMVLGKLPVPGRRPTNLDKSRAIGTGRGCLDFFSHLSFLFSLGWSGGAMVLGKLPVPGRPTCLG